MPGSLLLISAVITVVPPYNAVLFNAVTDITRVCNGPRLFERSVEIRVDGQTFACQCTCMAYMERKKARDWSIRKRGALFHV